MMCHWKWIVSKKDLYSWTLKLLIARPPHRYCKPGADWSHTGWACQDKGSKAFWGQSSYRTIRQGTNDGQLTHRTETSEQLACGKNATTIILSQEETLTKAGNMMTVEELTAYLTDKGVVFPKTIKKKPRDADPPNTLNLVSTYVHVKWDNLMCYNSRWHCLPVIVVKKHKMQLFVYFTFLDGLNIQHLLHKKYRIYAIRRKPNYVT